MAAKKKSPAKKGAPPKKAVSKKQPPAKAQAKGKDKPNTKTKTKVLAKVVAKKAPQAGSPLAGMRLESSSQRERALDHLCDWIVAELLEASGDDRRARKVMGTAIASFYDVRESANQQRGSYAGHFFKADGVGLGWSDREVPWRRLAQKVDAAQMRQWSEIFREVEGEVR